MVKRSTKAKVETIDAGFFGEKGKKVRIVMTKKYAFENLLN
jgi:hypothetical protein